MTTRKKRRRRYASNIAVDGRTVRYSIEWDIDTLRRQVERSRFNNGGRAAFGAIVVYVHPDDRAPRLKGRSPLPSMLDERGVGLGAVLADTELGRELRQKKTTPAPHEGTP